MEPSRRSGMSGNSNAAVTGSVNASSSVVGLLLSPTRATAAAAISSNAKATGLCHSDTHRVPSQLCSNSSNVIQHHQYPPILAPHLIRSSLVHPTSSLLPTSPQLMLSTTQTSTSEVIPRYQQHGDGGSRQLGTATTPPASASPVVMPGSNISTLGMVSPFGILPHERVVPHQTHHRHQSRKLPTCPPSSKNLMDTSSTQLISSSVSNPQRFYDEPLSHTGSKIKQYDSVQQSHHRIKVANGIADKNQPVVSSGYTPQSYESRYQPRTVSQQVGYLSVITRTAGATVNGTVMDDVTSNNNYYQAQASPLQAKTPDNHDRQYYHFDSSISASQTPQQTVDNMLLMTPVQRGDPMHIVKNLQSMQTDIDCYGVKKMIEQQPRLLTIDESKSVGPTALLNNNGKCSVENKHQHVQQLPKSTVTDPSLSYNSQYFDRRQPPPAHLHQHHNQSHLQQHLASGNGKMLPTPTSLTVVANGSTYYDQRHHRWNLDQQKPLTISTPSCFSGNIPTGMFHQPSMPQQQYNNTVSTFNVQHPETSIHQHQQMSESVHHNNFIVPSGNSTYYNLTTTMVSPTVTSVTTTSSSMTYNRHNHNTDQQNLNNFQNFANNVQGGNFAANDDNRFLSLPHVIVPNIEQELGHLCDGSLPTARVIVKPSNVVTKKPSFIDSYIKFLSGDSNSSIVETEDECFEKPKKIQRPLISSPPKLISKPYIPLSKPKVPLSISETPLPRNGSCEGAKNIVTTTDDDPRYFPLPKTSASTAIDSDESNSDSNWLSSAEDDHDQWWTNSSKTPSTSTASVIKSKSDVKKKKKNTAVKKKQSNTVSTTKKRKTNHEQQPKRQLSHRLAKEKTQKLLITLKSNAEDEDVLSDANSDVDPAWVPNNDDNDASKNTSLFSNRRNFSHKKFSKEQCSRSGSSLINNNNQTDDLAVTMPFKSGSFVALKSQFMGKDKNPQLLWRVDGKSLLQKFQRINGNTFRSATTYTGWGPSHYRMYRQVAIKFVTPQNDINNVSHKSPSTDILVKLISDGDNSDDNTKVSPTDHGYISQLKVDSFSSNSHVSVDDSMKNLRTNFDVYIQTLISQALDSNFLEEIYRENDKFFLSNMTAIETVTQSYIEAMNSIITQDSIIDLSKVENVCTLVTKYPDLEMLVLDESTVHNIQLLCVVCGHRGFIGKQQKFIKISLSGLEYNPRLLTNVDVNEAISKTMPTKTAHCCSSTQCTDKLVILHSLKHLKYHMYKECCKRITAENDGCYELTQETTSVLNRLLADEEWIKKLFDMACNTWTRAKMFISNKQSRC